MPVPVSHSHSRDRRAVERTCSYQSHEGRKNDLTGFLHCTAEASRELSVPKITGAVFAFCGASIVRQPLDASISIHNRNPLFLTPHPSYPLHLSLYIAAAIELESTFRYGPCLKTAIHAEQW